MRHVLWALLLAMACRSSVTAEQGLPYRCSSEDTDPCPGGWECRLDGFCHAPDDARAFACTVDTDCGAGWRCGVNHTCHARDPDAYPCLRDAGDSQCEGDWRCGLDEKCHSREPAAYACDFDAGSVDCEGDWRCGLNGVCHSRQAQPYACTADVDCEGGWRCGLLEGHCLDSTADALRPDAAVGVAHGERLSPRVFEGLPSLLSISPQFADSEGRAATSFALAGDGGVRFIVRYDDSGPQLNGPFAPPMKVAFRDLPLPGLPRALAAVENHAYALSSGQLYDYAWDLDGGTWRVDSGFPGFAATGLAVSPENTGNVDGEKALLIAYSQNQYALLRVGDTSGTAPLSMGSLTIDDIESIGVVYGTIPEWVAATSDGLFSTQRDKFGYLLPDAGDSATPYWYPVALERLPNAQCGATPTAGDLRALRIRAHLVANQTVQPHYAVAVEAEPWGQPASPHQVLVYRTLDGAPPDGGSGCAGDGLPLLPSKYLERRHGPCPMCPAGYSALSFELGCPESDGCTSAAELEVQCSAPQGMPDGGAARRIVQTRVSNDQCGDFVDLADNDTKLPLRADELPWARSQGASSRYASVNGVGELTWDAHGLFFANRRSLLYQPHNLLHGNSMLPDALVGQGDRLAMGTGVQAGSLALLYPGLGMVETPLWLGGISGVEASVEGAPDWGVVWQFSRSGVQSVWPSDGGLGAQVGFPLGDGLSAPVHSAMAQSSDGGHWLVTTAFDALLAANVEAPSARMEVKVVPLSRGVITSLVALPPEAGSTVLANGYLIAQARLFHYSASSVARWRADEVLFADGDPLKVFADGSRGRLGMVDGRVFSLPSRVQISDALTGEPGGVIDYAQLCGQVYALTHGGLYRLNLAPDGGPTGVWARETVLDGPMFFDGGYSEGFLRATDRELQLVSPRGRVSRLVVDGCQ